MSAEITLNPSDMTGFPFRVAGDMAWIPEELEREDNYTIELDESHIEELEHAMDIFKGLYNYPDSLHLITDICAYDTDLGLDGDCVCPENFPLPTIQYLLADITTDVHYGRGFTVLRGLDPSRYTAEDNVLLFLGISSYIGNRRGRQGQGGEMISKSELSVSRITIDKDRSACHRFQ